MNVKTSILTALLTLTMSACSHIDESDRLIYVKPADVKRRVLLEDFTGQRCVNCPKASDEIKALQEQYGEDHVIAVGIHSGPLGFYTKGDYLGLSTEVGDEYYDHWALEYQPVGLIDRGAPLEYTAWNARIREELEKTAPVEIDIELHQNDNQLTVRAEVMGIDGTTSGKLQLWLTEDGITAFQMMPDGTRNMEYIHRHVFRAAINGTWGESVSVAEGETFTTKDYLFAIPEGWNADRLSVVAFVYNDQGVLQAKILHNIK
jgi:hypothetical protein